MVNINHFFLKYKGLIFSSLLAVGVVFIIFYFIGVMFPTPKEKEKTPPPFESIDRTKNLFKNHSFEKEFSDNVSADLRNWYMQSETEAGLTILDNFIKKHGNYSLLISTEENSKNSINQKISDLQTDSKYIFFADIKTEDIDSALIKLDVFSKKDSLLFSGYSESLKGMNDWTVLNTWIRTQDTRISYIIARIIIYGKGRIWADNCRLYSLPIDYPFEQIDFKIL